MATMLTPVGPDKEYAFGWERKSAFGDTVTGHNGGAPGINAVFRRYQGSGYTVIVLSNAGMGASDVAEKIEASCTGLPYRRASIFSSPSSLGCAATG
eukprot:gene3728-4408_t